MRGLLVRTLCILVTLFAADSARAQGSEEILSYDVTIDVLDDGALEVEETIRVHVLGRSIKRGIYRDFPVATEEDDGRTSLATFEVLDVRRNGHPEPYTRSRQGAFENTRIGDPDVFLPTPSQQTYTLRYRTEGQLRGFDGYDELYWNVTGDRWNFVIREASVEIRLPAGTPVLQHDAYTGRPGESGRDFRVLQAADALYQAKTTAPLRPGEGFTVAVAWPPGAVEVPPVAYAVRGLDGFVRAPMTLFGASLAPVAAVAGTVLGTAILFFLWLRVGRDPAKGAVYPRWDLPPDLGPAAVRFVKRQAFDERCLTAAILSMAVKGALKITEREADTFWSRSEYTLVPLGQVGKGLTQAERAAYDSLFRKGTLTLVRDRASGEIMDKARAALRTQLWLEHYGASFRKNMQHTVLGTVAGVALTFLLLGFVTHWNKLIIAQWAGAALVSVILATAVLGVWRALFGRGGGSSVRFSTIVRLLPLLAVIAVMAGQVGIISALMGRLEGAILQVLVAGAAFGFVVTLFHALMAAPSKAGRALMDHIVGLEMYMEAAEEDRLDILNPPERTPELFERLLPYAVALGLSHRWAEKFADVLPRGARPAWFDGHQDFNLDRMDTGLGQAVASTTAPSRSSGSGSGGGGSSGGGGGGGGGGGW